VLDWDVGPPSSKMLLVVNGVSREVRDELTVAELLAEERVAQEQVLVEVNGRVLPAGEHRRVLADGDRVEIIRPAFGG